MRNIFSIWQSWTKHSSVINSLRDATNKAWAMGSESFKAEAEKMIGKRVSSLKREGDRKSQRFKGKAELDDYQSCMTF
jgi:putative transposase